MGMMIVQLVVSYLIVLLIVFVAAWPQHSNPGGIHNDNKEKLYVHPSLEITFPRTHSWWQVSCDTGTLGVLAVHFHIQNFFIPEDGYLLVTGEKISDAGHYRHATKSLSMKMSSIEPGSHFWTLELVFRNHSRVPGTEKRLHIEVIVPLYCNTGAAQYDPQWHYILKDTEKKPVIFTNLGNLGTSRKQNDSLSILTATKAIPICYIMSTSGAFDGQKKMWLQLMEILTESNPSSPAWMQFSVKTFQDVEQKAPWTQKLEQLNVTLDGLQLDIPKQELTKHEISPDDIYSVLLESFYTAFPEINRTCASGVEFRQATEDLLDTIAPRFASQLWEKMVNQLRSCSNGVLIFANSRSLSDEMLVCAARIAGVRSVIMELANLSPVTLSLDVLMAPSHFALHHPSVTQNVVAKRTLVLTTGIDTDRFEPPLTKTEDKSSKNLFIIGYVGRLSTEKSVGIVIETARLLQPLCAHCRIRLVGDGAIRTQLMTLAHEWELSDVVEFVNGIYNDETSLIRHFQELDVFISPLLRETLGIAVLEAMSVGIPVVGFISGGTSEFLEDGYNCLGIYEQPVADGFRDAILSLVQDPELRSRLGNNARQTVLKRFSQKKRIPEYEKLFERLVKRGHVT